MESGFNYQSFEGECGIYSLIHTLLLLCIPIPVNEAFQALGQTKTHSRIFGTEAKKIIHALQKYGCQAKVYDIDADKTKKIIDEALDNHYPVVLSVENSEHYAVLAGKNHNGYIYINSSEDDELIGECTWKEISSWLRYYEADSDEGCYYFIVVMKHNFEHSITGKAPELLKLYEKDETLTLINNWGNILSDLLEIFDSPKKDSVSAKEFFHKYREMILNAAVENYLYSESESIEQALCNYETVARMHSLSVSRENETEAAINMAAILTLLAVGIE